MTSASLAEQTGNDNVHPRAASFGMPRCTNLCADHATCIKALLAAGTSLVTIEGKTWDLHENAILCTTLEENRNMIRDSVACCKAAGREVFYDAEHFFDC